MKKYLLSILIASFALMLIPSCRSMEIRKQETSLREERDNKEQWRYQLPDTDTAPLRPLFPHVQKSSLKNGLTLLVVEDHRLPIAEVALVLKTGSAKDPLGYAGLNHLTALMLKEGTRTLTSLELAEAFANLGTEASIAVSKDMAQISSAVLSNKVDEAITLIASMVKEPRMASEDFARVKLMQQSLLSSQQGVASYVAQSNFLMTAYGEKHPYGYPSAGVLKTISQIELNNIKKAHATNFGGNIAALVVVGDVTLAHVEKIAKHYFGNWKKASSLLTRVDDPPQPKKMQTKLVARAHSPQTLILIGQPVATQKDHDLPALEVFQSILAGLPTSRLDDNLRERKGWTYGVASQINPLLGKGPMMVSTSIQVPFGGDALQEILMEFERLKKTPVSEDELNTAKNGLLHSFASRYSTVGKIANVIANQFVYSLPFNHEEKLFENIAKVTQNDILSVANRVLKKDRMVAIAVGDLEAIEAPIANMDVGNVSVVPEVPATKK